MYGSPLPNKIEERIATELYGDGVLRVIRENLKDEKFPLESLEEESFSRLHEVILKGYDAVCNLIQESIKKDEKLSDEEVCKKEITTDVTPSIKNKKTKISGLSL